MGCVRARTIHPHRPGTKTRRCVRARTVQNKNFLNEMARLTGLEPATPGVTGRYSNQLSYNRA